MNIKFFPLLTTLLVSSGSMIWLYAAKDEFSFREENTTQSTEISNVQNKNHAQAITDENTNPKIQAQNSHVELRNESEEVSPENLIHNWDLSELTASAEALTPFFMGTQPASIVYFDGQTTKHIYPKQYATGSAQSDKTLYLSSKEFVHQMAHEQSKPDSSVQPEDVSQSQSSSQTNGNSNTLVHMPTTSYDIISFAAGTRHDGSVLIPVAKNLRNALNGPDYSFDNFSKAEDEKMATHLETVLPLGNNGSIILQIRGGGMIQARNGSSFSVYQTTFLIEGTDMYWHKFASLGVSETLNPKEVKWFPCNPDSGNIKNCVGTIPTDEGGDQFNIAEVGLSQARYIWIKDVGNNLDLKSKWPTEGCALDALRIYHAYVTK